MANKLDVKSIIEEFERLENTEESHYWRWQLLGCFLKEDKKKLSELKTKKKLVKRSNRKIIDALVSRGDE